MTMTARKAFDKGTAAFNAHDIDGFGELFADDVVLQAPGGVTGEGKTACLEFYRSWLEAFPDAHVEIHGLHVTEGFVVEEGTFTGTHEGVFRNEAGDVPPTGRSVTEDYIQVLGFRDGQNVSFHLMYDRLHLLEQLGLIPAAAQAG